MDRTFKHKMVLVTLFILLSISCIFVSTTPNAQAAELTSGQKSLSICASVIGFDMGKYSADVEELQQTLYQNTLPEQTVSCLLNSNQSNIKMLYNYVNGRLLMLDVIENRGYPSLTKVVNGITGMARDFLSNYKDYTRESIYGVLESTLANIDSNINLTKIMGNTKLEVTNHQQRVTFRWTYTFNGIDAPDKVVVLGYENGLLEYFYDTWDLYKIGNTDVNISEEQAVNLGINSVKNYGWPVGDDIEKIKNFNVTGGMIWETVFRSSIVSDKARDADTLTLYPMRHVWVSLDKFYPPGNVYGFNVYIWADTGEGCHIQERIATIDPPTELVASINVTDIQGSSSTSGTNVEAIPFMNLLIAAICGISITGVTIGWLRKGQNAPKRFLYTLGGLLLCVLTLSSMLSQLSTADALSPKGRAIVWGSESSGTYYNPPGFSWRKHPTEVTYQNSVAQFIDFKFNQNGYESSDYQGSHGAGSLKNAILEKTSASVASSPRLAVIDFDHGNALAPNNELHFMFEDQHGTMEGTYDNPTSTPNGAVYDQEIYPRTGQEKVCFVFINACNSACIDSYFGGYPSTQGIISGTDRARGMPFAWSHRIPNVDLSTNGYVAPDAEDFVYLGFYGGSAALQQSIAGSGYNYSTWLMNFFDEALSHDITVNDALDRASRTCFNGESFGETALSGGFTAVWPMYYSSGGQPPQWHWDGPVTGTGYLDIFGNGNIRLYQEGAVWGLDDSGSTAYDKFVHHNDMTISGPSLAYGRRGIARSFDGTDDIIYRSASSSLNGMSTMTMMEWVKLDSVPATYSVNLGGVESEYWFEYRSNQYLSLSTYINSQYNGDGFYANLADGKWHLLAMTYDGIYKKGYLDGTLMAIYYIPGALANTANNFKLGSSWSSAVTYNGCPDGLIDEVEVHNYVLSDEEITDQDSVLSLHLDSNDYAYDSSPNGLNGTITGAYCTTGVRTYSGYTYGLNFDGSDDYINFLNYGALYINNAVTVEAWIKPDRLDVWQSPLEKGTHQDWAYGFYIEPSGGNIGFEIGIEGQQVVWAGATAPVNNYLAVGRWSHIVGTADRATGIVRLYIDGNLVSQGAFSGNINTNSIPLQVGKRYDGGYFRGIIDEVHIYDRALSSSEVTNRYTVHQPNYYTLTIIAPPSEWGVVNTIDGDSTNPAIVTVGSHTIQVSDFFFYPPGYQLCVFDHYSYNGMTDYNNPTTITVSKDTQVATYWRLV
jgi:hypothetical protein